MSDTLSAISPDRRWHHNAYLQWALSAVRMLRSRFVASDVDDLVLTKRYWHLQSASHVDLELASMLVSAEIAERVIVLQSTRL